MTEFLQHLVNGLSVGTVYALIALGYTMVYGVLKLINFAHGDVYMVGAFAGYYLGTTLGVDRSPSVGGAGHYVATVAPDAPAPGGGPAGGAQPMPAVQKPH